MKRLLIIIAGLTAAWTTTVQAQLPVAVQPFAVEDVRLTESPFKHAEDMDIRYLLGLDPDRLLAPYRKGAGLPPKAENYTNWENTGLDGHIGGHYLSALAYMTAATGNKEIERRLDYVLSQLKACQDAAGDGYLCGVPDGRRMWSEIERGEIRASGFGLNDRWVPLYNIHKIYAGLRDAWLQTHREMAREMLVKLADWMMRLTDGLTDDQLQDMLRSEHGGLNETFADVADIAGDARYLQLAHRFCHQTVLQPLLQHEDRLTGMHANTQIPKVIGFKRIADLEGRNDWSEAARYFWERVTAQRSISIGGNSVREHFHPANDFGSMLTSEQGPETCNTYNMLRLTKMLYTTSGDAAYMDYYERALYNHILSTQDPVQGGFVYFTPMRAGHYRVYSQPQTSFWCCVGSGLENHARYGEMIYGHRGDEALYVNLFIPSILQWGGVRIEQTNTFPDEAATTLLIAPQDGEQRFTLHLRMPEWANQQEVTLNVNGEAQPVQVEDGYVTLTRRWRSGDRVRLEMPMHLRAVSLPDESAHYSFLYGPIVLAARMGNTDQIGLFADDSRGGHIAAGPRLPLQQMPVVVGTASTLLSHLKPVEGRPLTFALSGVYPQRYEGMLLEPFFRLYETRYMVYWPLLSESQLQARQEQLAAEEHKRLALDARTLDKVTCGEQQPESDHFIQMERSQTGDDEGVHWREAHGWFSYRLQSAAPAATTLQLVYRPQPGRDAIIRVNGVEIGKLHASQGDASPTTIQLPLPTSIHRAMQWEVRITPSDEKLTPRLYEVRLLAK